MIAARKNAGCLTSIQNSRTQKYGTSDHDTKGLYRPERAKDSCGFGLIAHQHGETSHELVSTACTALARMTHRGAIAVDGKTGDGCGVLMQFPKSFFKKVAKEEGMTAGPGFRCRHGVSEFRIRRLQRVPVKFLKNTSKTKPWVLPVGAVYRPILRFVAKRRWIPCRVLNRCLSMRHRVGAPTMLSGACLSPGAWPPLKT